jgi:hypothetical protein
MWSRSDDRRPRGIIKVDIPSPPDDYREDSEDADGYGYDHRSPYQRSHALHSQRRRDGVVGHNNESSSFGGESSCSSSAESSMMVAENGEYCDLVDCRECTDAGLPHQQHRHHSGGYRSSRSGEHQTPIDRRYAALPPPMQNRQPEALGPSTSKPKTSLEPEDVVPLQPLQKPKVEEELCTICGDRASGYHYNALSCEGCKG